MERQLATPTNFTHDLLGGVIGAQADVNDGEVVLLQVLFQPVSHPWAASLLRAVVHCDGSPFFCGTTRDLVAGAKVKAARPLYAAIVRVACRGEDDERAWELARRLAGTLAPWADPVGNELIPLENDGYDEDHHAPDMPQRCSRRGWHDPQQRRVGLTGASAVGLGDQSEVAATALHFQILDEGCGSPCR
jgi:hypothetical protein